MSDRRKQTVVAVVCCVGAMLCFSGVPVVLRHLKDYLDHWTVNALRYSTAALFWLPVTLGLGGRRKPQPRVAPDRNIWIAALIPAACNVVGQVGWAVCPYYAEASTIGFVIRTSFVFTVLLGFVFIPSERPLMRRPTFAAAVVISMAGVLAMYLGAPPAGETSPGQGTTTLGMVLIIITAVFWGAYAVSVRKFMAGFPLRRAFGVISLYTAAVLVALMLLMGDYGKLTDLPAGQWALMTGSALVAIALGHVLLYRGIQGVGAVVTSGIALAGPFVTYLVAMVFLDEKMTPVQFIGGLGVISGGAGLLHAKAQVDRSVTLAGDR